MKGIKHTLRCAALFTATALATACTGYTEPEALIGADRVDIFADGHDAVIFSVQYMGKNVTGEAVIRNRTTGEDLEGNVFAVETPGRYEFTAVYNAYESYVPMVVTAHEASLELSIAAYSQEGEGDAKTSNFTFGAKYGTLDVSTAAEGLTVFDAVDDAPLAPDGDGRFRVSTTGNEMRTFYAVWDEHRSPVMTAGPVKFRKKVATLYFTGTWCQYCSVMAGYIKGAEQEYPDRNVWMAVHASGATKDPMAIPYAPGMLSELKVGNSLPVAKLDFGPGIIQTNTSNSDMANRISTLVEANPDGAACGIAIRTSVSGNSVTADVTLRSARAMEYGIMVALVEDGLTGFPQTMPDNSKNENYVHDHTLRKVFGDNIAGTPVGSVAEGGEVSRTFSFDLTGYKPANCRIVVFATTGSGDGLTALNAAECRVGESVDIKYESLND
jgi:hypothetical protein